MATVFLTLAAAAARADDVLHVGTLSNVKGSGHVVCHSQLVGFADAMKVEQDGARGSGTASRTRTSRSASSRSSAGRRTPSGTWS
jgi:hypothetical protein